MVDIPDVAPTTAIQNPDVYSLELYEKCVNQHKDTFRTWDFDMWQCTDDELVFLLVFMFEDRGKKMEKLASFP